MTPTHRPRFAPRTPPRARAGAALVLLAVWLAGCGSAVKLDEAPVENRTAKPNDAVPLEPRQGGTGTAGAAGGAGTGAAGSGSAATTVATVNTAKPEAAATTGWPAQRVVYFDFDSYVVRPDAKPVVEGHARVLMANQGKRLVLEGHTDERGGREYNLALGQKRAEAVARSLVLLGVAEGQLEPVSFGKERPAVEGRDEASWEKNRRVELKEKR